MACLSGFFLAAKHRSLAESLESDRFAGLSGGDRP